MELRYITTLIQTTQMANTPIHTKQPDVKNANVVNASLTRPPTVIDRHPQQQSKTTNNNHPDSRAIVLFEQMKK